MPKTGAWTLALNTPVATLDYFLATIADMLFTSCYFTQFVYLLTYCQRLFIRLISSARYRLRRGYPSSVSPSQKSLWKVLGGWFSLSPLGLRLSRNEVNGKLRISVVYSYLAIHVLTASSTALDKSPFLPPNFSIVLNLSCFSSSSDSSTLIRPIFNYLLSILCTIRTC